MTQLIDTDTQQGKETVVGFIQTILSAIEPLVTELLATRKQIGDYPKEVNRTEGGWRYQYSVHTYRGKYPAVRKNMSVEVDVFPADKSASLPDMPPVFNCLMYPRACEVQYFDVEPTQYNSTAQYLLCRPLLTDKSKVVPAIKDGDSICVYNQASGRHSGNIAFAKLKVLSEQYLDDTTIVRGVELRPEFGHPEQYAYEKMYGVETFVGDDSTKEFFAGEETKRGRLCCDIEAKLVTYNGYVWKEYHNERINDGLRWSTFKTAVPHTVDEVTARLKKLAMDNLLRDCQGEFCYGDPRVEKYQQRYQILGDELIWKIHDRYLLWLKIHADKRLEDGAECSGIAIDWQGQTPPPFEAYLDPARKDDIALLDALPATMAEAEALLPMPVDELCAKLERLFGADFAVWITPVERTYKVKVVDEDTYETVRFSICDGKMSDVQGAPDILDEIAAERENIEALFKV